MHKNKKHLDTTSSRSTYNKRRKIYLENDGQIYCSFCPYHRVENLTKKYYGGNSKTGVRYPSWKLVSKNRKQWMKKGIIIKMEDAIIYPNISDSDIVTHYDISWKRSKYSK